MSAALAFPQPSSPGGVWLPAEVICAKAGISPRSLVRYAANGQALSRTLPTRLRNGRYIRKFLVESLPSELRHKLEKANRPRLEPGRPAGPSEDSAPLFAAVERPLPGLRLSLPARAADEAGRKLGVIEPLLNYTEPSQRAKYAGLRLTDGRPVTTADLLADYIVETRALDGKTLSRSTLWNWVRRYRKEGLPGLARKVRADQGTSQFFTRFPAAATLAAAEYHKPYATVARAYEAILRDQELLRIAPDEMPSYETVRSFLASLPAPMGILAREGQREYNERCAPHVSRAYTDIPVNNIWVADHMIHDVEVRNDCFAGVAPNAPMRLRLTAIMDMRSRKFVGVCWTAEGDSRSIATALRRACEAYGPCDIFYCDNGRDFKKTARGANPARPTRESVEEASRELVRRGALQRLGIDVQFCLPYRPQSKPIERAFGTVHKRLDGIFPHYTSGNAYSRPDQTVIAGAEHRKLLKHGLGHASTLMPASQFIQLASTWIEHEYNAGHHHTGKGMGGRTPNEVFDAGYPVASRRAADPEILATLLHDRKSCTVRRTAVTIEGRRYMPSPTDPASWAALSCANETSIVVAYDPLDPNIAIALDARGCRLATLQAETLTAHAPEAAPQIQSNLQIGGRLLKSAAISIQQMHRTVALAGHKSDLQHLADLAVAAAPESSPVAELISQRRTGTESSCPTQQMHSADIGAKLAQRLAARRS